MASGNGKSRKGKALDRGGFKLPEKPKRAVKFTETVGKVTPETFVSGDRRPSNLRRTERGERLAVYLPPELAEALKLRCVKERRSVSDAVTAAVDEWLKS